MSCLHALWMPWSVNTEKTAIRTPTVSELLQHAWHIGTFLCSGFLGSCSHSPCFPTGSTVLGFFTVLNQMFIKHGAFFFLLLMILFMVPFVPRTSRKMLCLASPFSGWYPSERLPSSKPLVPEISQRAGPLPVPEVFGLEQIVLYTYWFALCPSSPSPHITYQPFLFPGDFLGSDGQFLVYCYYFVINKVFIIIPLLFCGNSK